MSGLERRLEALEASAGVGGCAKHAGVLLTLVNGTLRTATRRGEPMAAAEGAGFAVCGGCPACGAGFLEIRVPSEIPAPSRDGGRAWAG